MPSSRMVEECGVCGNRNLESRLWLGYSPPACSMRRVGDRMGAEERYPLELLQCPRCTLVQLSCVVDPLVVFHRDYGYSTGNTRALVEHFRELADEASMVAMLAPFDVVVDIGANDGTLLGMFPEDCVRVAIEPTAQINKAIGKGLDGAYQMFFNRNNAMHIARQRGLAKLVTACNVLAHVDDIHDTLEGIVALLDDDGILVAENHSLESVVNGGQWDTVYHEHLRYWSPESFGRALEEHGLHVWAHHRVDSHGGSFRTYASKTHSLGAQFEHRPVPLEWERLRRRVRRSRDRIRNIVRQGTVFGVGAAARASTVINYCGLDADDVRMVCEVPTSDKLGHYMPGTRIPVVDERALWEEQPGFALLFSWHVADGIIENLRAKGFEGAFIVPLPEMRLV